MSEQELFESLQRNVDAAVEAELASRRTPIRGHYQANGVQETAAELGLNVYGRILNNRRYAAATDPAARQEFAALTVAWRGSKITLQHVQETIAAVVRAHNVQALAENELAKKEGRGERWQILPEWLQERPSADAGTIPELPIDKATGLRCRNPWLPLPPRPGETQPHFDHASQAMIREQSPRLAKWLEECAANEGLPSVAMLDELEAERLEAKAKRELPYGEKEWEQNKFRKSLHCTVSEQGDFAKSIESPYLLQFHRDEAKAGSPRLMFGNLSIAMELAKRSPEIREIHKRAEATYREWRAEQQKAAA
jgi:hypothetical protein